MENERTVKIGIIGLGGRTEVLLVSLFAVGGVEIPAVCDLSEKAIAKIKDIFAANGKSQPDVYRNYRELLQRSDIEAVMAPTSWNAHLPIAADAPDGGCRKESPFSQSDRPCGPRALLALEAGFQ